MATLPISLLPMHLPPPVWTPGTPKLPGSLLPARNRAAHVCTGGHVRAEKVVVEAEQGGGNATQRAWPLVPAAETGRGTLSQSQSETSVLSIVQDSSRHPLRDAEAPTAGTPAIDPARAAEQEQLKRLAMACMAGDANAWQQLVKSQHRRVYGICYRFTGSQTDAEDLTQDVFIKLYRSLSSFDPAKGAFQTWITTLTRNLLVDHFRRTRQDRATDSLDVSLNEEGEGPTRAEQLADTRATQFDTLAQQQLRGKIQVALKQISPELREAVILRDLQDMDYKEIAQVLRVPEGTVKSRISRGRGELARILQREGLGKKAATTHTAKGAAE